MKTLSKPVWFLLLVVLPQSMFFLLYAKYMVAFNWLSNFFPKISVYTLAVILIVTSLIAVYGIVCTALKKPISPHSGWPILLIDFLLQYLIILDVIYPTYKTMGIANPHPTILPLMDNMAFLALFVLSISTAYTLFYLAKWSLEKAPRVCIPRTIIQFIVSILALGMLFFGPDKKGYLGFYYKFKEQMFLFANTDSLVVYGIILLFFISLAIFIAFQTVRLSLFVLENKESQHHFLLSFILIGLPLIAIVPGWVKNIIDPVFDNYYAWGKLLIPVIAACFVVFLPMPRSKGLRIGFIIVKTISVVGAVHLVNNSVFDFIARGFRNETYPELITTSLMAAGMISGIYLMVRVLSRTLKKLGVNHRPAFLGFFSGLLLIILLFINTYGPDQGAEKLTVFSNLSDYSFAIFVLLAGLLLLLPVPEKKELRFVLFGAKCLLIPMVLYTFIVFWSGLPATITAYTPLRLIGLLLLPWAVLLMTGYIVTLRGDFKALSEQYQVRIIQAAFYLGIAVLPLSFIGGALTDAYVFQKAYNYLDQTDYSTDPHLQVNLQRIRNYISNRDQRSWVSRSWMQGWYHHPPHLVLFYDWLVTRQGGFSNRQINKMDLFYLGSKTSYYQYYEDSLRDEQNFNSHSGAELQEVSIETRYNATQGFYRSWVHLKLKNRSDWQYSHEGNDEEYSTVFNLPSDCFISNYYLYVGKEKRFGELVEKQTAKRFYNTIVQQARDPGILYYLGDQRLGLRVYPFRRGEIRRSGFEIIHKGPVYMSIDGHSIELNGITQMLNQVNAQMDIMTGIQHVSAAVKDGLPRVKRPNRYYFILDSSNISPEFRSKHIEQIKEFVKNYQFKKSDCEIVAVNFNMMRISMNPGWEWRLNFFSKRGGFNLEMALKRILYQNYLELRQESPVFIVVTDNRYFGFVKGNFENWGITFPEADRFFQLDSKGLLHTWSLLSDSELPAEEITGEKYVRVWPDNKRPQVYLTDDQKDSYIVTPQFQVKQLEKLTGLSWENGTIINAVSHGLLLEPGNNSLSAAKIIKASIRCRILNRQTAFIVLETNEQMARLKQGEKNPSDLGQSNFRYNGRDGAMGDSRTTFYCFPGPEPPQEGMTEKLFKIALALFIFLLLTYSCGFIRRFVQFLIKIKSKMDKSGQL